MNLQKKTANTLAEAIIAFHAVLKFEGTLPKGIRVMNPFAENEAAMEASASFYRKFYGDNFQRRLILGINPGRYGAGVTGIPFTDTKRLEEKCQLQIKGLKTHEPSSVFVYQFIDAFGGPEKFYSKYLISSVSPLGFVKTNHNGRVINYNYYDSPELLEATRPFIIESINKLLSFGIDTSVCFCLGNNKNYRYLSNLNSQYNFFGHIVPLEHPRYIMQYKATKIPDYIEKYLNATR
jgi:hypothetical protein